MPQQAAQRRTNGIEFFGPLSTSALHLTAGVRHWNWPAIGRNWTTWMYRLRWTILSPGVHEDGPDLLIAAARFFLAATSLVAICLDSTHPARLGIAARTLLFVYVGYSAAIFVFERIAKTSVRYGALIHAGDILWAAVITSITEGPNSPFFLFFLFALISAAYRWDMRRVMLTAASLITVLVGQAIAVSFPAVHALLGTEYDTNRFIMRAAYLVAASIVIGYIGDNEKRLIREAAFVGSLVSIPRAELGLKRSAQRILCETARFFGAPRAAMLIRIQDGSTYLLEVKSGHREDEWADLPADKAEPWLFSIAANCAWVVRNAAATNLLDRAARWRSPKSRGEVQLPLAFVEHHAFHDMLMANLVMGEEWSGRILLFDPRPHGSPTSALDLLDRIVHQVTPAVHNVYLLRRIRERAQAVQRQRLAHDLHDGAIQALVAARLQLEVLQRKYVLPQEALPELRRTQEVVRSEILNLRMMMHELSARSVEELDLAGTLPELVNNVRRSTSTAIELLWDPASMKLPNRVAREALKIIQEALLNINKHSGAKNISIELNNTGSELQITIQDDGIGLEFDGRMRLVDLDLLGIGPRVIKQRLHGVGGSLVIESHPGKGSRLEVAIPLSQNDASILAD